ncbi:MAG: RNA polymerase sigma factor [Lachnospiraceae bacterium]|nr:RNA polymerase sigma factor [Lachnospiraceae bacterium]
MNALVEKAQKNDPHAFSLLYEMVYEDLYKMAYYTLMNRDDAEDAVSETVLDAYQGIGKLRDKTAFRSWIFRILSAKCSRIIKEYINKRQHEVNVDESESTSERVMELKDNSEDISEKVVNHEMLETGFKSITEEERLIVTMIVYGGYNSSQVEKILGINRSTVRSKYTRALKKMREAIEGNGG